MNKWLAEHFDFALVLVALTAISGLIWLLDKLIFRRQRSPDAAEPVVIEYARSFFPVLLIVLIVRSFLAEPFRIPSGSMMPTLIDGDFILVNKFSYGVRLPVSHTKILDTGAPTRGDVAVFRFPGNPTQNYIKRIVGIPGDTIEYRRKKLYVNGKLATQQVVGQYTGVGVPHIANNGTAVLSYETIDGMEHEILTKPSSISVDATWVLKSGEYFGMGDNRDGSSDSRVWGVIPEENLVGKAFVIWMNFDLKQMSPHWGRLGTLIE